LALFATLISNKGISGYSKAYSSNFQYLISSFSCDGSPLAPRLMVSPLK
jgi:hypothetical protein